MSLETGLEGCPTAVKAASVSDYPRPVEMGVISETPIK